MTSEDSQTQPVLAAADVDPDSQAPATAPSPVLVLGMHRSGTSVVARILNLMGAYIGEAEDLMPPHAEDNPTGYWERRELVIAHDDFLRAAGHSWDRVSGFDLNTLENDLRRKLTRRVHQVVANQASHGTPWLVKDPRLSLLLPIWLEAAPNAACIVVVRDPREIAASMRESHRGIYTSHFLLALWEKYLVCALQALRGRQTLFVSYSDLLSHPEHASARLHDGLQSLGVAGLRIPSTAELHTFLDAKLRRSSAVPHTEPSVSQQALFAWLQKQCDAAGPVQVDGFPDAAPDAVLREFERTLDDNAKRARTEALGESAQRLAQLESTLANQHARLLDEMKHARAESAQLHERIRLTEVHVTTLEHINAALKKDLGEERARGDRLDAEKVHRQSESEQLQAAHGALSLHASGLTQHAKALEQRVQAMRSSISWKATAPLRGLADLLTLRLSWNLERTLHRVYYAIPGISTERKQKFIERVHDRFAWLTRNTQSYRLRQQPEPKADRGRRMDQQRADALLVAIDDPPLISIAMPVYNVDRRWLMAAVESVRRQFYPHWELCIADDASTRAETRDALVEVAALGDARIKIRRLDRNLGIAGASNMALELISGDYVGLLDHDDELTRDALLEMAQAIAEHKPDMLYSDEDKMDETGAVHNPVFKPDYSPEYFLSNNYLCHFTVLRASILKRIGGFRTGVDGAQDFDLFLRFTAEAEKIIHVPKVLYHWRMISGSTAATATAKPYTWEAGRLALQHRLELSDTDAKAEIGPYPNTFRVRYAIRGEPLVSIIIPFRDKPALLETCVRSILQSTDYRNFEIVGVDNASEEVVTREMMRALEREDSRVRFVSFAEPFNFSAISNFGASHARGQHLLFLNNDTEVLTPEWLRAMLEFSQREDVGVVGAKLLYPDDTIQHAGVILDRTVVAMHPHQYLPKDHPGYAARTHLPQNLSAVTFACAMTRREVFERLEGLNSKDLAICYNDVDYCLRAREAGYLVVFTPYSLLRHFESKSRGVDDSPEKQARFQAELAYMRKRHAAVLAQGDPYYNPNLSLGVLSGFRVDPHYADDLPL